MSILNLHGFLEKASNENKRALCRVFPASMIISPSIDYTNEHPSVIMSRLKKIIKNNGVTIIVGQCLGGYYAVRLSKKFGIPCVITNPCLFPTKTKYIVESKIGKNILYEYSQFPDARLYRKIFAFVSDGDTLITNNYENCKKIAYDISIKQVEGTHNHIENVDIELWALIDIIDQLCEIKDIQGRIEYYE